MKSKLQDVEAVVFRKSTWSAGPEVDPREFASADESRLPLRGGTIELLNDLQEVTLIERCCAPAARPRSLAPAIDPQVTSRATESVFHRPTLNGEQRRANLRQRNASQRRHPVGDPVIPMMGVSASVPIDVVAHVQELLGDDDLDRTRARNVDPLEVDQHRMATARAHEAVRAANGSANRPPADPPGKRSPVSGNVEFVDRKRQERKVFEQQVTNTIVTQFENHGSTPAPITPMPGSSSRPATVHAAGRGMIRPRTEERRHHERPHVLIITDDPSLATFLSEGLPLGGFWTSVIASGLQALEVFRLRQFDLVVIDATLQSFDAVELMRRLRGTSRRARGVPARTAAPFVVFGTFQSDREHAADPELGIVARFEPPVELEEIVPVLHQAFAQWRSDHPDAPLADAAALRDF